MSFPANAPQLTRQNGIPTLELSGFGLFAGVVRPHSGLLGQRNREQSIE